MNREPDPYFSQDREQERAARLQVLREAVVIGVGDTEAGRYTASQRVDRCVDRFKLPQHEPLADCRSLELQPEVDVIGG